MKFENVRFIGQMTPAQINAAMAVLMGRYDKRSLQRLIDSYNSEDNGKHKFRLDNVNDVYGFDWKKVEQKEIIIPKKTNGDIIEAPSSKELQDAILKAHKLRLGFNLLGDYIKSTQIWN